MASSSTISKAAVKKAAAKAMPALRAAPGEEDHRVHCRLDRSGLPAGLVGGGAAAPPATPVPRAKRGGAAAPPPVGTVLASRGGGDQAKDEEPEELPQPRGSIRAEQWEELFRAAPGATWPAAAAAGWPEGAVEETFQCPVCRTVGPLGPRPPPSGGVAYHPLCVWASAALQLERLHGVDCRAPKMPDTMAVNVGDELGLAWRSFPPKRGLPAGSSSMTEAELELLQGDDMSREQKKRRADAAAKEGKKPKLVEGPGAAEPQLPVAGASGYLAPAKTPKAAPAYARANAVGGLAPAPLPHPPPRRSACSV